MSETREKARQALDQIERLLTVAANGDGFASAKNMAEWFNKAGRADKLLLELVLIQNMEIQNLKARIEKLETPKQVKWPKPKSPDI